MKRLARLIYSNKFFAFLMLIFQLFVLSLGAIWLSEYNVYLFGATSLLSAILIIVEINRGDEPTFKLTWTLLIAIIPVFGALLYIYLHTDIMTSGLATAQKAIRKITAPYMKQDKDILDSVKSSSPTEAGLINYLSAYGGSPAYKNTAVKYYSLGDTMIPAMIEELKTAKQFIFIEFFIINRSGRVWPEILSILKKKVNEGVEVRVLFDGMGCLTTLPKGYVNELRSFGIKSWIFSPIQPLLSTYQNNRDHRKIMVIDGKTAFTGGINLADEYANYIERFGHWKDVGVKVTGDAVAGFTAMFLEMWNMSADTLDSDPGKYICEVAKNPMQSDGIVIPYGDSPLDSEYVGKQVYIYIINSAAKYCHIMTPYLAIDNEMFESLKFAAQRGVDVKIIMPHTPDKKTAFWLAHSYYPELIKAGIKIYEYTPGFNHAKLLVSDDLRAAVGTVNFDFRSMYLHYECAAYMYEVPEILEIESDYQNTLEVCTPVTTDTYKRYPMYTKFIGRVVRPIAPLI